MIFSHIAAMAKNRVIGKDNQLPWNIPEDFKFFKEKTKGHIMIMGRKTFDSLPMKPLPGRYHIVISRNPQNFQHPQVQFVQSFDGAVKVAQKVKADSSQNWPDEIFIIGGGEIYKQTLPKTDRIYLTVIEKDYQGDAYYPEFTEQDFQLVEKKDRSEPLPFSFRTYERIR